MSQVLAQKPVLSDLEVLVLTRLRRYQKPVKTKHLADRMGIDRPSVTKMLNRFCQNGLIYWHVPDKLDDKQWYGWKYKFSG